MAYMAFSCYVMTCKMFSDGKLSQTEKKKKKKQKKKTE